MARKLSIPFSMDEDSFKELQNLADAEFNSRSALIAKGIHMCYQSPEKLGYVVGSLLSKQLKAVHKHIPTALSVPEAQVEELEEIASKLSTSRSAVLNLVVKGLVHGYI